MHHILADDDSIKNLTCKLEDSRFTKAGHARFMVDLWDYWKMKKWSELDSEDALYKDDQEDVGDD